MFETLIFARTTVTKRKYRILSLNPISYLINLLHGFAEKHPEEDRKAVPLPKYWKLYSCTFFSFANFRLSFCYSAVPSFRVLRSPVFQLLSRSRREEVGCKALRRSSQALFFTTIATNLAIWLVNLPMSIRVQTTLLSSMCHALGRALNSKKKLFLWRWYCGKKTNRMWYSVVCPLINNDMRHQSSYNVVDSRGAAEWVNNKFWPRWHISSSIRVLTTLYHIRVVNYAIL